MTRRALSDLNIRSDQLERSGGYFVSLLAFFESMERKILVLPPVSGPFHITCMIGCPDDEKTFALILTMPRGTRFALHIVLSPCLPLLSTTRAPLTCSSEPSDDRVHHV